MTECDRIPEVRNANDDKLFPNYKYRVFHLATPSPTTRRSTVSPNFNIQRSLQISFAAPNLLS
jgi:hypothetical protein